MLGSAIIRALENVPCEILAPPRSELDLRNQRAVDLWIADNQPDYVFLAAGNVGGIQANITYPADFIYDNTIIAANVIKASYTYSVKKLLYFSSSCIYPRHCPQPIKEEMLMSGQLEPTNAPYAVAKLAGISLCQSYRKQHNSNFISCIPTNLYGPGADYGDVNSHVVAALMSRFHEAKLRGDPQVIVWGTGKPRREFLYVDDLAQAALHLIKSYDDILPINVGTGKDITIKDFAELMKDVTGYEGNIIFDSARPDGMPCKCLDVSRIKSLGWSAKTSLREGLKKPTKIIKPN